MQTLQGLADSLSRLLHTAVAIDDNLNGVIIQSCLFGHFDEARITRILAPDRRPNPEVLRYIHSFYDEAATRPAPIRTPARPDLGLDARVHARLYYEGKPVGSLVVFDQESTVTEADMQAIIAAAESAALIIETERLAHESDPYHTPEIVADLLSSNGGTRRRAIDNLASSGLFVSDSPVFAVVVQPVHAARQASVDDSVRESIRFAFEASLRALGSRRSLNLVRHDYAVLLLAVTEPLQRAEARNSAAEAIRESIVRYLGGAGEWDILVGVGSVQPGLETAYVSYNQAAQAARAAIALADRRPVAVWDNLGLYRLLLQFPRGQLLGLPPNDGWQALVTKPEHRDLVATLETYLDHAGRMKETAAELGLHRGTLLYRLKHVEQLTQVSLADGEDRLALHLWLKLTRLSGLRS